jgi:3-deoxy-manno-octulosonate cytidylyltransferase (CMP-KDO synthetase)
MRFAIKIRISFVHSPFGLMRISLECVFWRKTLKSVIVIPARLHSTRLPRKLLLAETGKPLIQHTYESALRARLPAKVFVAADHEEIANVVRGFGGEVVMTDPAAPSGTDRVAEVARSRPEFDIFVNVQGDEPDISGAAIDSAIQMLCDDSQAVMSTLATPIRDQAKLKDPACVKVVADANHRALYFSRSMIPFPREWDDRLLVNDPPIFLQHVGLYAYRREFLLQLASLPPAQIERVEKLEQLRVLDAGFSIHVGLIDEPLIGIDTPADYQAFVSRCHK